MPRTFPRSDTSRLKILFVSTECSPWVKSGGLGDVSSALPRALVGLGHDVRVLLPAYAALRPLITQAGDSVHIEPQGPWPGATLNRLDLEGFPLWVLDCPELYDRAGSPYGDAAGHDHADNALRFAFLSHVAAELCAPAGPWSTWAADILHANDWPTGLAPAYLSLLPQARAASVFTIHNLAFQGNFDAALAPHLAIPAAWLNVEGILHWNRISMMKAGLRHAGVVTTVSPTYAREIQSPEFGCGLEGMLQLRSNALVGLLNGIDTREWNPATDTLIASRYSAGEWTAKARNNEALRKRMGLATGRGILFGMVSRLTSQKGVDLVLESLERLLELGGQLVVLGSGEAALEQRLRDAAQRWPGRVAVQIGFDEALAHLVEAGADCFLMPSRFEPCGLNQMYSLVYGTPPIVHATGGLADTVTDADASPDGTGFVMTAPTSTALSDAIERAVRAFADRPRWRRLQQRGMRRQFGWSRGAAGYVAAYKSAIVTRQRAA